MNVDGVANRLVKKPKNERQRLVEMSSERIPLAVRGHVEVQGFCERGEEMSELDGQVVSR